MAARIRNLSKLRFGKLVVIRQLPERIDRHVVWYCKCDCGNTAEIQGQSLTRKTNPTRSCGCIFDELNKNGRRKNDQF